MRKKVYLFFLIAIFMVALSYSASITVTNPHSGDTWYKGHTYTITWTKSGNTGINVKINIFKNSISPANFIEQLTGPNNNSKSWTIPSSYTNGTYYIRIKGVDGSGNDVGVYGDSGAFTITDAPVAANITVTSPHSGDSWCKGNTYTITWTKSGNAGVNVKINIFKNSISPANFIEQLTGPNNNSKSWTISSSYTNGTYYIRIKGVDGSGNDIGVFGDSGAFTISDTCSGDDGITIAPWIIEKLKRARRIIGWGPWGPIGPDPDPICPQCLKLNISKIREVVEPVNPYGKRGRRFRGNSPKILVVLYMNNEPVKELGVIEGGKAKFRGSFAHGNKNILVVNLGRTIKRGTGNIKIVFKNAKTGAVISSAAVQFQEEGRVR